MKPPEDTKGRACLACCLAAMLEMDIDLVPDFYEYQSGEPFWNAVNEWLHPFGLFLIIA